MMSSAKRYSCSMRRSPEMKYEAISLLSLLVLPIGSLATDIFDGMEDGTSEPDETSIGVTAKDEPDDVPKTCVKDIVPQDSISLSSKALESVKNLPNEVPQAPPIPNLGQFWTQITTIFQQPSFAQKVEEAKQVSNQYRALIKTFSDEWVKFFTKKRQAAIENVQKVIQDTNQEIKSFFTRHLSEFDGMCLPDDNECLQSVQNGLEEYSKKVQEIQPLVAANAFKRTSQATQKFATVMGRASASVTNRLGRFRTCVVERKRLLAGGQDRIAAKATACLRAQKSSDLFQ